MVALNRAAPRDEMTATTSWWTIENETVVEACAAEGHVTVARLSSTTKSARHQVENRWNMHSQATVARP